MQTINLKQYYPFCTEDTFVEVSDEIVEAFLLDKRAEAARERKMYPTRRFTPLTAMMGLRTPPLAGAAIAGGFPDGKGGAGRICRTAPAAL